MSSFYERFCSLMNILLLSEEKARNAQAQLAHKSRTSFIHPHFLMCISIKMGGCYWSDDSTIKACTRPSFETYRMGTQRKLGFNQLLQILAKGRNVGLTPAQAGLFVSKCFKLRHKILNATI